MGEQHMIANKLQTMGHAEFKAIRHMTGCNREQFSNCFGIDYDDIVAYENCTRDIPPYIADYLHKIRAVYETNRKKIVKDDISEKVDELRETNEYLHRLIFALTECQDCIEAAQIIKYGPDSESPKQRKQILDQAEHYICVINKQKSVLDNVTKAIEQIIYHG